MGCAGLCVVAVICGTSRQYLEYAAKKDVFVFLTLWNGAVPPSQAMLGLVRATAARRLAWRVTDET
jgi:hypothetical protein